MRSILTCFFALFCAATMTAAEGTPYWSLNSIEKGWNTSDLVTSYFHHSELQRQWAWELMGKQALRGDEKILDFGCGDGKISAELSHFVSKGSVKAVDISQEMLQFAHIKFPQYAYPHLTFQQSHSLTFDDILGENSYDLVCSFCVFHQVKYPLDVLKNLKNHLKPGGKLVLVIPAGKNPALFQAAEEVASKYQIEWPWKKAAAASTVTMRTLEGCSLLLSQAGYKIALLEMVDRDNPFYDKEELIAWMFGTMTANWNIPEAIACDFYRDVIQRMMELDSEMIDSEGRIHFKLSRIHVVATVE